MEGMLHAASEVKELLVHEVDKHLHQNKDSSSTSSSSSDEDEAPPPADTVVTLNDNIIGSSSSSSTDEEAPAEDLIIIAPEAQIIAETNSDIAAESEVQVEANPQPQVVTDYSESSESDEKVLPIQEEEETLVAAADSLPTPVLVSSETQDSPPQNIPITESTLNQHTDKPEIPQSSGSPVLVTTVTHPLPTPTSWMSCCGLFQVLRRHT